MSIRVLIVPGGVVNSYRKRYGEFHELNPIRLVGKNEYALPLEVLNHPAFDGLKPDLNTLKQRDIQASELEGQSE